MADRRSVTGSSSFEVYVGFLFVAIAIFAGFVATTLSILRCKYHRFSLDGLSLGEGSDDLFETVCLERKQHYDQNKQ